MAVVINYLKKAIEPSLESKQPVYEFRFPTYVSTTKWKANNLKVPTGALEMEKIIKLLHSCVFQQNAPFFHWVKKKDNNKNLPVIASNNVMLESAMWHLQELTDNLNTVLELKAAGKDIPNYCGAIFQCCYKKIVEINNLDWPDRDNSLFLLANLDRPWEDIKKNPCQYKIEWYLMKNCNHSLRDWLKGKMILYQLAYKLNNRELYKITSDDLSVYQLAAARAFEAALNDIIAQFCPDDYKAMVTRDYKTSLLKSCYLIYLKNCKRGNIDVNLNYFLLKKVFELAEETKTYIKPDFYETIQNAFLKIDKERNNLLMYIPPGELCKTADQVSNQFLDEQENVPDFLKIEALLAFAFKD